MIEKMKMVHVITSASAREEMLKGLQDIGVMHIAEKQNADRAVIERYQSVADATAALKSHADPKKTKKQESLTEEGFVREYATVREAIDKKAAYEQEIVSSKIEIGRVSPWGDFQPSDVEYLRKQGFDFHFYTFSEKDYQEAASSEDIKVIKLGTIEKSIAAAVLGTLPPTIQATEFVLPEKSLSELRQEIADAQEGMKKCDDILTAESGYYAAFHEQQMKALNELKYSEANASLQGDSDFAWISGYIPEVDLDKFKAMAAEKNCAWDIEDVDEEDTQIPTKLRYTKVSKLIKPIYDILDIHPGYREQDISLWFFLFFILFFAMIIGDGGYGLLILAATIAIHVKQKKLTDPTFLLYILSIGTIVWGAVTGTWFGMESAMKVPFLRALVIPSIATYPDSFGVTSTQTQFAIMKFSLSVGIVQLVLGKVLAIKKKLAEKDLSLIAEIGWMIAVICMYMLSLNLVIGEDINLKPVFIGIGIAFVTVVLFGGMTPGATFGQSVKSGLAGSFTTFLDTISCFSNVMSYIRLFAVGMAGVAISQSFNDIGAGMPGILVVVGAVIIILGHALNIAMCFLSVVVHGVRLNVLEFSGQAGIEWAGVSYDPFKEVK
ncbi:MAG: hypothetical protein IKE56_04935 [Lachnospiraceae bacterium]|jgi:V/A-type H+-transporting ATPase subunit I|nr:hypothetical protein [Lachnospiraceae bacterium]